MHRQAGHDYINVSTSPKNQIFPLEEEKKKRENNNVTFSVRFSHTHSSWHERMMKHALVLLAEGKDKSLIRPDPVLLRSISLPYRARHGRHLTDLAEKHLGVIIGQICQWRLGCLPAPALQFALPRTS